jgi:hypothetical protein
MYKKYSKFVKDISIEEIEYPSYKKLENLAILRRNDRQGYDIFGYDVVNIEDIIRDMIQDCI